MQVLSDGAPMTNGEVYALLRRRRDERSAALHPGFCLQHAQADPQQRASSQYYATPGGNGGGTASGHRDAAGGRLESKAHAAAAVLSSPSASRLLVLLTEVKVMSYLANTSHLSSAPRVALKYLYGPSTVYPSFTCADNEGDETMPASRITLSENEPDHLTVRDCQRSLPMLRAGTVGHVRAVSHLLDYYEATGRQREQQFAHDLRQLVVRVSLQRRCDSVAAPSTRISVVKQEPLPEVTTPSTLQLTSSLASRPLLSLPSSLTPYANMSSGRDVLPAAGVPAPSLAVSCSPETVLTEAELMRLVVARPQSVLEVHRLVDQIDERFGMDEAALAEFVEEVIRIFE